MHFLIRSYCIIVLSLITLPAFSQSSDHNLYDNLLKTYFPAKSPGCVALVAKNGKVVFRKAYGLANLELQVQMQPEYKFRIGSITKQFTAALILKLAEEGKLSLQDSVGKYLDSCSGAVATLTIEQLLTHTSGLGHSNRYWNSELRKKDMSPRQLVDVFLSESLEFSPGSSISYNNNGYILLGLIIEQVTRQTYQAYLRQVVFEPLGMRNSTYENTDSLLPYKSYGYRKAGNNAFAPANYLSMTQPYSAGAIVSTADDLLVWINALVNNRILNAGDLKKATSSYQLKSGKKTGYGYGWWIGNIQGSSSWKHDGLINGFTTQLTYLPEEKVCVILLTNCEDYRPENIATQLAAIAINKPYPQNELKRSVSQLKEAEGVYESENGTKRYIERIDDALYTYSKGGGKQRIYPFKKDLFWEKNTLEILHFVRDENDNIGALIINENSDATKWKRISVEAGGPVSIQLDLLALEKFCGDYIFKSNFVLHIIREETQLYGIGDGPNQIKQLILPFGDNKFFAKYLDAQLWFNVDYAGKVVGVTKIQNGKEYAEKR